MNNGNASSVIVNVVVNTQQAQAGVAALANVFNQITVNVRNAAQNSAAAFNSIFGANFFANLASNMVQSLTGGFRSLVSEAVSASAKLESALTGVGAVARNLGFSEQDVIAQVKGLDLVQKGLLTVADAATTTKNLLASGFNLQETNTLIKAFGDTAAFGRQASLSFGEAIRSGSEGIKNGNSILVDNLGITKNLSVILKEAGKSEKDVMNVRSDASVRMALYNGLLKEANLNQGDAAKLLNTTQGALVQADSAYQRFLQSLGNFITQSEVVKGGLSGIVSVLDFMGKNIGTVVLLTTSITALTVAVALSSTSFTALTAAQIANSVAGSGLARVLTAIPLILTNVQYAAALTAGEIAILTGGLLAVVGVVAAVAVAFYNYNTAQAETTRLTQEQLSANVERQNGLQNELNFLNNLNPAVAANGDQQTRLAEIYKNLNPESKTRVDLIKSETSETTALIAEKERLLRLSEFSNKAEANARVSALAQSIKAANDLEAGSLRVQQRYQNAADTFDVRGNLTETKESQQKSLLDTQIRLNDERAKANDLVKTNAQSVADYNKTMGVSTEQTLNLAGNTATLGVEQNALVNAVNNATGAQNANANALNTTTNAVRLQIEAIAELGTAQERQSGRGKFVQGILADITEQSGGDIGKAKQLLAQRRNEQIGTSYGFQSVGGLIDEFNNFNKVSKELNDFVSPKPERARKVKSEYDSLTDSLKKMRGEVAGFTDLNSKEFKLRFDKEELERTKRDFEQIISLRRDLNLVLSAPLPTTAQTARAEIENLERVRDLRDDILTVFKETQTAEDALTKARLTANAEVVSAQVRADTAYFEGLRGRRDAEAQLTADIITEIRRREYAQTESVRNQQTAQAEATRDYLKEENDRDYDRLKNLARLQILAGGGFSNNPLIPNAAQAANPSSPAPALAKMDKTNNLLSLILQEIGRGKGVNYQFIDPNEGNSKTVTLPASNGFPSGVKTNLATGDILTGDAAPVAYSPTIKIGGKIYRNETGITNPYGGGSTSTVLTPVAQGVSGASDSPKEQIKDYTELNKVASEFFQLKYDDVKLSTESQQSLIQYLELQRRFAIEGLEGLKENAIGQDRIAQKTRVNITQTGEMAVATDRLNRLRQGGIAVTEAINDGETKRANDAAANLTDIIQKEKFLQDLRNGDAETLKRLAEARKGARTNEITALELSVREAQALNANGGRDSELERLRYQEKYYSTLNAVGKTEAQIAEFRALRAQPEIVAAGRRNDVLSEQLSIEQRIATLEDARATAPINAALRERVAVEQELTNIYLDEYAAAEDAAVSRVRINDLSVYHETRANARVLEHIASMKGLTEIYSDAKISVIDKVWGGLDKTFEKLTSRIPVVGSILKDILSNLTKMLLNPFLMQILGLGGAASSGTSRGTANGGAGSLLGNLGGILTGGANGSNGVFNLATGGSGFDGFSNAFASGGASSSNRNPFAVDFGFGGANNRAGLGDFSGLITATGANGGGIAGAGKQASGNLLSSLFGGGKFDFKSLGKSLGSFAPLLGAGLGASLGGQSGTGSILGSGGGILAGGVLSALVGGSLTGATTGGIFGSIGGLLGISAGATAGIALAAAPLLLLGSYFLGRDKLRKQEEKQRTQILTDAQKQLRDILAQTRSGSLDSVSALAQANSIREQYLTQVGQLKDKKTRNIAIATVRDLDSIIEQIRTAGRASDFAKAQDDAFVPTFDGGGVYSYGANAYAMNRNSYNDTALMRVNPDTEAILTRRDVYSLGGYGRMAAAGVRGASSMPSPVRQEAAYQNRQSQSNRGGGGTIMQPIIVFDDAAKDKLIANSSGRTMIQVLKPLIASGQDEGFIDTIGDSLAGE